MGSVKLESVSLSMGLDVQPKNIPFKSSHFDEPNILVHLRMNTRIDAEGNKVLFLEEIQSDWGQKGKKEGYKTEEMQKEESGTSMPRREGMKGFYGEPSEGKEGIVGSVAKALVKELTGKPAEIVETKIEIGRAHV